MTALFRTVVVQSDWSSRLAALVESDNAVMFTSNDRGQVTCLIFDYRSRESRTALADSMVDAFEAAESVGAAEPIRKAVPA